MSRHSILRLANLIVAGGYVAVAVIVASRAATGRSSISGSLLLIALSLVQAIGHARLKIWALKISAALVAVMNLLAIPYLLAVFEPALLPPFQQRILIFALITTLMSLLVLNYRICAKTEPPKGLPLSEHAEPYRK